MRLSTIAIAIAGLAVAALIAWLSVNSIVKQRTLHDWEYPIGWARLNKEWLGCPDLTGSYQFKGDWQGANSARSFHGEPLAALTDPRVLQDLLKVEFNPNLGVEVRKYYWDVADKVITHVSVLGPRDNAIRVSLWNKQTKVHNTVLQADQYECHFGLLTVRRFGETGSISSAAYDFQKAVDGSLVASTSRTTIGLLILFPYKETSVTWQRWPSASDAAPRGTAASGRPKAGR